MDADVEPVPCRDCGTPTLPNMGWCQPCDEKQREWAGRSDAFKKLVGLAMLGEMDRSAGRWCEVCGQHGSHHTDRHDTALDG